MVRFITDQTAPITEESLKVLTKDKPPKGVFWKVIYCDFADNKFFCDWEAPNKETIELECKARKIPSDAIYPVQLFNVAKAKLKK